MLLALKIWMALAATFLALVYLIGTLTTLRIPPQKPTVQVRRTRKTYVALKKAA